MAHNGSAFVGGGELWTVRLLRDLADRGHRVVLFVRDRNVREQLADWSLDVRVAHLGGQVMVPEAFAWAVRLRRLRPDALLLTTFKKVWLGGMAAALARVPRTVLRIGLATDLPRRSAAYRFAIRHWVDTVVTNAHGIRRDVLVDLPDLDPVRVVTVHNGVRRPGAETRALAAGDLRRGLGIPAGAFVVGTVARLVRDKRQDRLIDAAARLPRLHVVLAGEGPHRTALHVRARAAGVDPRVHFLGHVDDPAPVLAALDLYVVSSDVEGMSNAMLEAMAWGVPVVSTPVSGADDALDPLEDGTPPGRVVRPDALSDALRELEADPAARRRMGRAALRRVAERFDADRQVDRWESILFDLSTNPPS